MQQYAIATSYHMADRIRMMITGCLTLLTDRLNSGELHGNMYHRFTMQDVKTSNTISLKVR